MLLDAVWRGQDPGCDLLQLQFCWQLTMETGAQWAHRLQPRKPCQGRGGLGAAARWWSIPHPPGDGTSAPGAVAQSILHFDYICNVTVAIQPRCRGVQCKCWSAVFTHPSSAQPAQSSPAQPGSARHKSLALNFSEWNLLIRWDYRHYSQSSPPATGHRAQPGVDYKEIVW